MSEPASSEDGARRTTRSRGAIVAVALCAAAFVAAVVMAVLWTVAALQTDSSADAAATDRNAATQAAGDAAVALTTVSLDDIDGSLDRMHAVTTGELSEQFAPGTARDELAAALKDTGVAMTTDLNSAVLTSFDEDAGTASAMAFVVRNQTLTEGQTRTLRQGISLNLQRTDDGWKVADFDTRFAGVGDVNGDDTGAEDVPAQPGDGAQPADPGAGAVDPGAVAPGAGDAGTGDAGTGDAGAGDAGAGDQAPAQDQQSPAGS